MTLKEARKHIGDVVVYRSGCGHAEDGVITSVNDCFVFVRYGSDRTSKATHAGELTLLAGATS